MKLTRLHWMGIICSVIILIVDTIFFLGDTLFLFLVGIAALVVALPFLLSLVTEGNTEREMSERFLEFTRTLAETVKTGTPIAKSIINMRFKDFGVLTPHIQKLANQISLGIPVSRALETFASDSDSVVIKRAVTLIREAEKAGGEIDFILDSTAESIYQIEKLKRERRSNISNLVVQGYIIFFIFVAIMLIMQFKILPLTANVGSVGSLTSLQGASVSEKSVDVATLGRPFLYLLLIQGFFAGLTIGKLSEGSLRGGIKHSIILMLSAFLISTGANVFL